jgi:hypothetical protein
MTFQPPWERGGASRPSRTLAITSWTAVAVALVVVIALPFVEWGSRRAAETAAHQAAPAATTGQGPGDTRR